jgi:hypothetical protein
VSDAELHRACLEIARNSEDGISDAKAEAIAAELMRAVRQQEAQPGAWKPGPTINPPARLPRANRLH